MLTDERIDSITDAHWGETAKYLHAAYRAYGRAIEAAACADRDARIAELEQRNRDLHEDVQRFKEHALNEKGARLVLERELAEVRKDAERYRWLKEHRVDNVEPDGIAGTTYRDLYFRWYSPIWDKGVKQQPVFLDAAIDAAMRKGKS